MIVKAKEGLEDLYSMAKISLERIQAEADEEFDRAVKEIRERIDTKYATKRDTLTKVVDSLSESYEEPDPVDAEPTEQLNEEPVETLHAPQEFVEHQNSNVPEELMSL